MLRHGPQDDSKDQGLFLKSRCWGEHQILLADVYVHIDTSVSSASFRCEGTPVLLLDQTGAEGGPGAFADSRRPLISLSSVSRMSFCFC